MLTSGRSNMQHFPLDAWMRRLPTPCIAGMEATLFTAWVYDQLIENGLAVKVDAAMLKGSCAGKKKKKKKKNDHIDAQKLADLLRCDYFPECHIASKDIRDRRRILRYRTL